MSSAQPRCRQSRLSASKPCIDTDNVDWRLFTLAWPVKKFGTGGVGKTSLSTATALTLADAGEKVLLVSTDAASGHSLPRMDAAGAYHRQTLRDFEGHGSGRMTKGGRMRMIVAPAEFHISIRVSDLDESTAFYTRFLGVKPKDSTARFATFIVPELRLNLVLLVNDSGRPLDTYSLYHIGLGVADKAAVIETYLRAKAQGVPIVRPPRTTWRGTPLHELWLRDPTGYGIEIYARLTPDELAAMPADMETSFLVPGTGP